MLIYIWCFTTAFELHSFISFVRKTSRLRMAEATVKSPYKLGSKIKFIGTVDTNEVCSVGERIRILLCKLFKKNR